MNHSVKKAPSTTSHLSQLLADEGGNTRMDTVLKMLLITFIALLAFSSGVYFGKQLSDSDYQLKALESDFTNTHGAKLADGSFDGGPEETLNREEAAALSESLAEKLVKGEKEDLNSKEDHGVEERKLASDSKHATAAHDDPLHASSQKSAKNETPQPTAHSAQNAGHSSEPAAVQTDHGHGTDHGAAQTQPKPSTKAAGDHHPAQAHSVEKPDLSAATKAAMRVAANAAPIEPPKAMTEKRIPTSLPKTVGLSQDVEFTVQVASFPTAEVAKEHADILVKKGFPAFPVEATINGKVWYRVSVGSFKTMKEATAYRAQLLKQANVTTAIVQKITR
jgi:cell division protein FtsN